MKLNILIYNSDLNLPTFVYKLGEHLVKQNHQVTFMGQSHYWFAFSENGMNYYPLPYSNQTTWLLFSTLSAVFKLSFNSPLEAPSTFRTIRNDYRRNKSIKGVRNWLLDFIRLTVCKQIQPDIIHNQWSPALAALEPLFDQYPIVQSLWGRLEEITPYHSEKISKIYKKFYPKIKGFHSVNNQLIERARNFGAKDSNTAVTYTNVDYKRIKETSSRTFKFKQKKFINIISVGDYSWRKGHVFSLEAMKILEKKGIKFRYKIIGKGDDTECNFHIKDLNLNEYVSLQNQTGHNQIFEEFAKADIFLLGSIQEGFATVVTEAMASNIPVIATSCSGMPELLKDKINSWLISPFAPSAIADGIIEIVNTPQDEIRKITTNAISLVEQKLIWEKQISNYIKLYQNALN